MSKTIEALQKGYTLQSNTTEPRYYKMVNGVIYYSTRNEDYTQWRVSTIKRSVFNDDTKWIIL